MNSVKRMNIHMCAIPTYSDTIKCQWNSISAPRKLTRYVVTTALQKTIARVLKATVCYTELATAGRDGKVVFSLRDGTIKYNGSYFLGGTDQYEATIGGLVDGTGSQRYVTTVSPSSHVPRVCQRF